MRPARGHRVDDGIVRFVMWTGSDGQQVIPFFSTRGRIERILTPKTEPYALAGRQFLEATRGATVVLNPNEAFHCRLAPHEVAALLDTGAVSAPEVVRLPNETVVRLAPVVETPTAALQSLVLLYAQHPAVVRAYLVSMCQGEPPSQPIYLIAIELESGDGEAVARETSAVMLDVPPEVSTDLLVLHSGNANLRDIAEIARPFYDRALGAKIVQASGSSM